MTTYGAAELASGFRTVRKNTIQIAEDIPESKYDFVPAPGTSAVGTQLKHIAISPMIAEDVHRHKRVTTLKGYDFAAILARMGAEESKPRSKAEIIALLKSEGERLAAWMESLPAEFLDETFTDPTGSNPRPRLEALLGVKEHEMHHRGQLMLVERMLGITPHLTRQRQERLEQHRNAK